MERREMIEFLCEMILILIFVFIISNFISVPLLGRVILETKYTLADYPKPFFDNEYNFDFVVSDNANVNEYQCAVNILNGMKKEKIIIVEENDKIPISIGISSNGYLSTNLDKDEINGFYDGEINFDNANYKAHDELNIGKITSSIDTSNPSFESSLSANKDYEENIYLDINSGTISYHFVIDNNIDLSKVSENTPLKIRFLGEELTITKIDDNDTITGYFGEGYLLSINQEIIIDGKKIIIENIGQDAVIVNVDNTKEIIRDKNLAIVNGLQIYVEDILYRDAESKANLIIGSNIANKYSDNQEFICNNDCWIFDLNNLLAKKQGDIYNGDGPTIGIEIKDNSDDKSIGECINLPFDYAKICIDSFNIDKYANYNVYKESVDFSNAIPGLSGSAIILETSVDNGFLLKTNDLDNKKTEDKSTSKIYLRKNDTSIDLFYDDSSNKINWAGSYIADSNDNLIAEINFGKTSGSDIRVYTSGNSDDVSLKFKVIGNGISNNEDDFTFKIGNLNGLNQLLYNSRDISDKENERTIYGIIFDDIKDGLNDDDIILEIPEDQLKVKVSINGQNILEKNVISNLPNTVKDSEVDLNKNLIVIGRDNKIYANLISDAWNYDVGEALIKLVDDNDKYLLFVAGTSDDDLLRACNILREYSLNKNKLTKNEVFV